MGLSEIAPDQVTTEALRPLIARGLISADQRRADARSRSATGGGRSASAIPAEAGALRADPGAPGDPLRGARHHLPGGAAIRPGGRSCRRAAPSRSTSCWSTAPASARSRSCPGCARASPARSSCRSACRRRPDFFDDIVETAERHVPPAHQHPRPARLLVNAYRMPFAICDALPVSYAESGLGNSTSGFSERGMRMNGGRVAQGKHDRLRSFPGAEPDVRRTASGPDRREIAMLRHDISGALHGVIGGLEPDRGRRRSPEPVREQFDRIAAAAKTARPPCRRAARPRPPTRTRPASRPRSISSASCATCAAATPARPASAGSLSSSMPPMTCRAACMVDPTVAGPHRRQPDRQRPEIRRGRHGPPRRCPRRRRRRGLPRHRRGPRPQRLGARPGLPLRRAVRDVEPARPGPRAAHREGAGRSHRWRRQPRQPRPSGGVEAVLRFPASRCGGRRGTRRANRVPTSRACASCSPRTIPTNQMVASQMLRALNAEVIVCSDGVEALERSSGRPSTWWSSTSRCRRMSGLDVIRAIRARGDARAQVPIVALTAYAMREHRERIAAAGANGLISKPSPASRRSATAWPRMWRARRAAPAAQADSGSAGRAGPVIDQAIYAALCEAIGRGHDVRAARQGDRRPPRRAARPRRRAGAARPRPDPLGLAYPDLGRRRARRRAAAGLRPRSSTPPPPTDAPEALPADARAAWPRSTSRSPSRASGAAAA